MRTIGGPHGFVDVRAQGTRPVMFISGWALDNRRLVGWILAQKPRIVPIPGTTKHQALKDALIAPQPGEAGRSTAFAKATAVRHSFSDGELAGHALGQLACLVWLKQAEWCPSARLSVNGTAVLNGLRADEGVLQGESLAGTRAQCRRSGRTSDGQ